MKKVSIIFLFLISPVLLFIILPSLVGEGLGGEVFSQSTLDATAIADKHYNSIVKILLYDSLSEKNQPHSGYIGRGSGFFVSDDGIVFTNRHVVEFCFNGYIDYEELDPSTGETSRKFAVYSDEILNSPTTVKIYRTGHPVPIVQVYNAKGENDYSLYFAKVVAYDASSFDGAILKVITDVNGKPASEKFHPVQIGNSDSTKQGEDLCLYGFPAQYDAGFELMLRDQSTLTFGKHSGFDFVFNKEYGYIKTDASINSGNSGGPVFNSQNKVIGIATATGSKTNIGLIGGVNAMYNISSVRPDILKTLKANGLKPPKNVPTTSTVFEPKKKELPSVKKTKRLQVAKTQERKFQNGTFYVNSLFSFAPKDEYTLDTALQFPITNPNTPLQLVSSSSFGIECGDKFPAWRISPHVKLSVDWTFIQAKLFSYDWQKIMLNDSVPTNTIKSESHQSLILSTKLGPAFSFLIGKQVWLEAGYQLALAFFKGQTNALKYGGPSSGGYANRELTLNSSFGLQHTVGLNVRFRVVSIGMQYAFSGKQNLDFVLTDKNGTSISNPAGTVKINSLFFTLGVAFSRSD